MIGFATAGHWSSKSLQEHALYFLRQGQCLFLLLLLLISTTTPVSANEEETNGHDNQNNETGIFEEEDVEPFHAVLFPAFCLTIGVVVFFLLTRYLQALPYTAVMFFIGTLMGIGAETLDNTDDQLNESIRLWLQIDSEVLLLIFLPGLIFKDAIGLNVHLFRVALTQCFIFAFPMVLAGTTLTALVAYYIFPYNWSFNLAMTFGSILSATDPVAVAALLEAVGAPPRLKVHIAGEALLNDGAAIVFFSIFAQRYFFDLGLEDIQNVDLGKGVAIFFQKSLGGVAIGIFFGLGLLFILSMLNRRFNREENIVEVTATMAIAYIGYYVAEPVWETSGVIATLTAGVVVKALGRAIINDAKLLDDFWRLVEHLLNTVLFTLGGTVWGAVIASGTSGREGFFTGRDWGYLFLLYILLHAIRLFLFATAYPITSRIGLKTNTKETIFQVYGGLRGAVGIALALALDNEISKESEEAGPIARLETRKLFGFVGGFAFMTLTINGSTAGPLLRRMGLADSTETRGKIVDAYRIRYRASAIDNFVRLLTQKRFKHISFALVKFHVPILADLTKPQLIEAVEKNKETTPPEDYQPPYLKGILPYMQDEVTDNVFTAGTEAIDPNKEATPSLLDVDAHARKVRHEVRTKRRKKKRQHSTMHFLMGEELMSVQELRTLFISILKAGYERQIRDGELEDRQFLAVALEQSLEFAADAVSKGEQLRDWDFVNLVDGPLTTISNQAKKFPIALRCFSLCWKKQSHEELKHTVKRVVIQRCLAFMAAHRYAQSFFRRELENAESELSEAGKVVISESLEQQEKAEEVLNNCDRKDVEEVASHLFCAILLNSGVHYIGKLVRSGLLKEEEAEHLVEAIEVNLDKVKSCDLHDHPGEIEIEEDQNGGEGEIGPTETGPLQPLVSVAVADPFMSVAKSHHL